MIDPFGSLKRMYLSNLIVLFLVFKVPHADEILRCRGESVVTNETNFKKRSYVELINHDLTNLEIPLRFDAREKWQYCKSIKRIKSQGECGACWAFATTSVIADRICIASKGKYDLDISIQDLIQCCTDCLSSHYQHLYPGCQGGITYKALEFFVDHGLVTGDAKGCKPLEKNVTHEAAYTVLCEKKCTNPKYSAPYEKDKWYGKRWTFQNSPGLTSTKNIQAELMLNGPMVVTFKTFFFMSNVPPGYILSYYPDLIPPLEGGLNHAAKLIGWDVKENGTPVWIIANSWGKDWCDEGFCSIKRGVDELALELHTMMAVVPRLKDEENEENKTKPKSDESQNSGSSNYLFRMFRLFASILILVLIFF